MSSNSILVFRLEGPLQSWGEHSHWDYRDTSDFPTKSGVVGMIACAMGLERGNPKISKMCTELNMCVRADRKGYKEIDFHTVTGNPLTDAKGKKRSNGNTIISNRGYLNDGSFLVAMAGPEELLVECKNALENPKWQIYLGRKCCVPSVPVSGVISNEYNSVEELIRKWPLIDRHDEKIIIQTETDSDEGIFRSDITMTGYSHRFLRRKVKNSFLAMEEM